MHTAKASGSEKEHFLEEIELMKKIASGENPNIVRMIGCVTCVEPLCLLTEHISYGDLLSYLKSIRNMVVNIIIWYRNQTNRFIFSHACHLKTYQYNIIVEHLNNGHTWDLVLLKRLSSFM